MSYFTESKIGRKCTNLIGAVIALVLIFSATFAFASVALAYNIVVLTSKEAVPYNSFVKAFKIALPGSSVKVMSMDGDSSKGAAIIYEAVENKADLIIALGPRAAWAAKKNQDIPVMFSMLSNPKKYKLDGRSGVRIGFSLYQKINAFKKIMPNIRKIGVLYSENSEDEIDDVKRIAHEIGIEIVAKKISDVRKVAEVTDDLLTHVDALWLRKDKIITSNAQLLKQFILVRALRKRVPVIGENKWAVKNGALFCLFSSYQSIGTQAVGIVDGLIAGSESGFQYPSDINIFINSNVAERLSQSIRIVIPRDAFFVK